MSRMVNNGVNITIIFASNDLSSGSADTRYFVGATSWTLRVAVEVESSVVKATPRARIPVDRMTVADRMCRCIGETQD